MKAFIARFIAVLANPGGYCGTTLPGKDVYSRTNKAFGTGIDYKF